MPCERLCCVLSLFRPCTRVTLRPGFVDTTTALSGALIRPDAWSRPALDSAYARAHTRPIHSTGALPTIIHGLVTDQHATLALKALCAARARQALWGEPARSLCPSAASPTRCNFGSAIQSRAPGQIHSWRCTRPPRQHRLPGLCTRQHPYGDPRQGDCTGSPQSSLWTHRRRLHRLSTTARGVGRRALSPSASMTVCSSRSAS